MIWVQVYNGILRLAFTDCVLHHQFFCTDDGQFLRRSHRRGPRENIPMNSFFSIESNFSFFFVFVLFICKRSSFDGVNITMCQCELIVAEMSNKVCCLCGVAVAAWMAAPGLFSNRVGFFSWIYEYLLGLLGSPSRAEETRLVVRSGTLYHFAFSFVHSWSDFKNLLEHSLYQCVSDKSRYFVPLLVFSRLYFDSVSQIIKSTDILFLISPDFRHKKVWCYKVSSSVLNTHTHLCERQ